MSKLDQAIAQAQSSVPDCIAVGCVDVDSGLLMGVKTLDSHPREVLDLVAAATADLFQGPNVLAIESIFKKTRGVTSADHYFQEVIINSTNLIHVFARTKKVPNFIAIFVCKNTANIGMVLAKSRLATDDISKNI